MKNVITFFTQALTKACFSFFLLIKILPAQPNLEWQKCLGGSDVDAARSIFATSDGGYVVAGKTLSNNGDVSGNHGVNDFWVVKMSAIGIVQWKQTYGGSNHDRGYSIHQTFDGGYIVAGETASNDGDVSGNHGDRDFWIIKLNSIGALQWQKTLGGSKWDEAWSVRQTTDGGYIVAGRTLSTDGDVTGKHAALDFWVVKLDGTGTLQWQKALGGSGVDIAYSVRQTLDGGYVVAGESSSNDGDASGQHGNGDYWVVKLTPNGEMEWQKMLGSTSIDSADDIYPTKDGGYIVVGIASANSGDVTGNHGGFDIWAVKLNSSGAIEWQKSLGGSEQDYGESVHQTSDGGYVIAGSSPSTDGDVQGNDGLIDVWVVKLTPQGELQWQKTYGGPTTDEAYSIQQTSNGGFILAGFTQSNSGDVSGFHGVQDYWVVKLSPESVGVEEESMAGQALEIYPNPARQTLSLQIPSLAGQETALNIVLTDPLGREMKKLSISNGDQLDISSLPKGLYFLTATTGSGKMFSGKVWKGD